MQTPLTNKTYLLEKFPGKGGWTYAQIPEVPPNHQNPFGWVRVKGTIDGAPIHQYHLMPMGNGCLFLPVKAAIRKQIGKQAGDCVQVVLFLDDSPRKIPENLRLCLEEEPSLQAIFNSYSQSEQKAFTDWINAAKTPTIQEERIAETLSLLEKYQKLPKKLPKQS